MLSGSAASAAAAASQDAIAARDHQKFNQFLRYNANNAKSKKHEDCKTLALLYKLATNDERKGFIARWLRSGGSKGDLKVQVQQELIFFAETSKLKTVGHMTPGQIAKHCELVREVYADLGLYEAAVRFEIEKNQKRFPPPPGQDPVDEGIDFWTSRFWYTHLSAEETKQGTTTGQQLRKSADLAASSNATPQSAMQMIGGVEANLSLPAPPEEEAATGRPSKEQVVITRKVKAASRSFSALINHLAKCRTQVLLNGGRSLKAVVDKAESECASIPERLAASDVSLEEVDGIAEKLQTLLTGLHKCFPDLAPRSKRPRPDQEELPEPGAEELKKAADEKAKLEMEERQQAMHAEEKDEEAKRRRTSEQVNSEDGTAPMAGDVVPNADA